MGLSCKFSLNPIHCILRAEEGIRPSSRRRLSSTAPKITFTTEPDPEISLDLSCATEKMVAQLLTPVVLHGFHGLTMFKLAENGTQKPLWFPWNLTLRWIWWIHMLGMLRDPVPWFQGSVAMILSPVTMLLGASAARRGSVIFMVLIWVVPSKWMVSNGF